MQPMYKTIEEMEIAARNEASGDVNLRLRSREFGKSKVWLRVVWTPHGFSYYADYREPTPISRERAQEMIDAEWAQ